MVLLKLYLALVRARPQVIKCPSVGAVPEPSRAMLAGLGLMGLVIRRRRK